MYGSDSLFAPLKAYRKDVNGKPFYEYTHTILLLLIYEVLIRIFYSPNAVYIAGPDLWYRLAEQFIPFGTLSISLALISYRLFFVVHEWRGIKTPKEQQDEQKKKKEAEEKKKRFEAKGKKKYRPNWYNFSFIIIEGFIWGTILYITLPVLAYLMNDLLFQGTESAAPPLSDDSMQNFYGGIMVQIALAFGSGIYDELIFRSGLIWLYETANPFNKRLKKFMKKKDSDTFSSISIMFSSALVYTISAYVPPYGEGFTDLRPFFVRFFFGIALYHIYRKGKLPLAAWTHVFYNLWYFILN